MKLGLTFLDKDVIKRKDDAAIITKKEYVTYLGSVTEFKQVLFDSASRSGYGKVKKVVIIADGAHWIWNMCNELFPDAEYILDFFHMKENVYDYAKALFSNDEKKYNKWAETMIHYIKTEQIQKALKKISEISLSPEKVAKTVNLEGYIKNNMDKINYLQYKNKGYYIGSGMIESGNKIVVQKRMKQAGMRWSINGAQYMAVLRAKHESNNWKDVEELIFGSKKVS
jgi:transposase-like protein